jgi:hypothetical protein
MSVTFPVTGIAAAALLCVLTLSGSAAAQTFITYNLDNANTYGSAINASGTVVGDFVGDFFAGYVRAPDGTITTYSITLTTISTAINRGRSVTGFYQDNNNIYHGFLRKPGGKVISFDPAGSTNTEAFAINDSGVITGFYNTHGFVRAPDGTITSFDPSGSTATNPTAINAKGDIAGYYNDASGNAHGFLRMANGAITSFDVKNATSTQAYGINRRDAVVGTSFSKGGLQTIGFERTPGGKIKTFTFKGVTQTMALGINGNDQIIGFYNVSQSPYSHGFVGSPEAGFLSFDVPNGSYTQPASINDDGDIAGTYLNTNGLYFAFIRKHNLHSRSCRAQLADRLNPC